MSDSPTEPIIATWGLVPTWSNDKQAIWDKTLNARGETILEKPAFKESAATKRCIVFIEGFYEHRHKSGSSFPYFIQLKRKTFLQLRVYGQNGRIMKEKFSKLLVV
jgi:putative SOS response-associated peptidase YedK